MKLNEEQNLVSNQSNDLGTSARVEYIKGTTRGVGTLNTIQCVMN